MKHFAFAAALAAATLTAPALATSVSATEVNFGIISTESQQNLKTIWDPFLADMAKETGLEIKPFFASDYAGVIEGMRFGKVDIAWFGNKSAMEAVDRAKGEVFAQTVAADGSPGYWSVLIVPANSPINSLDDVLKCDQTINFGMGDPNSTSGFLVPTTFIFAAKGVDPKTCFKTIRNSNHETNALAVANGQADVATNNTENLARLEKTNPEAFAKIKVIWQSPLIPSDPLVWRSDLDPAVQDRILRFLMSYGRSGTPAEVEAHRKVLAALGWAPFRPSSDAQLYPVRIMELTKKMFQVEADEKMTADEKKKALAELDAKKAEYQHLMATVPQI